MTVTDGLQIQEAIHRDWQSTHEAASDCRWTVGHQRNLVISTAHIQVQGPSPNRRLHTGVSQACTHWLHLPSAIAPVERRNKLISDDSVKSVHQVHTACENTLALYDTATCPTAQTVWGL